jgi:acyl-CoA reductase-like NAD-dependent aldehyde dehydrogenase
LIAGEGLTTAASRDVVSPYSGEVVGRVAWGSAAIARRAVDEAHDAMRTPLAAYERVEILLRAAELIAERGEELAQVLSAEAGKPIRAARVEVERAAFTYRTSAHEASRLVGDVVPMDASATGAGRLGFTVRVPVGVVAAITPFNFPLNLAAHKLAPALAAGCAVVLKPSSQTPLTALMLAEISADAGLPPGWLNVVTGEAGEISDVFAGDDRVALISFTGSGDVGWGLRARCPRKRVALELGNSSPVIVESDADLEAAVPKLVAGAFGYAGPSCISVQRIYAHERVYGELLERLTEGVRELNVGDPSADATDVGPVIDRASHERILAWLREAIDEGATVETGGPDALSEQDEACGLIHPTVLTGVTPEMKVSCAEVFGPVVSVTAYADLDEALGLANGTRYGLQAAIFTANLPHALRAARRLSFGSVVVNEPPTFRTDQMPYGGVNASGNTKEGPAWTIREMTHERLVVLAE